MKIQILVFLSEIKFILTPKKSHFLFLLCFYLQKIGFYLLTVCVLVLFNIAFNNFSVILRRCLVATDRELSAHFLSAGSLKYMYHVPDT